MPADVPADQPAAGDAETPAAGAQTVGGHRVLQLLARDRADREKAFEDVVGGWHEGFLPMVLEVSRISPERGLATRLNRLAELKTGQRFGSDFDAWWDWQWNREFSPHPDYPEFKAALYGLIDPKFRGYFSSQRTSKIRLAEVRWGASSRTASRRCGRRR